MNKRRRSGKKKSFGINKRRSRAIGKRNSGKRKSGKRNSGKRKSGKRKSGKRKSGKHSKRGRRKSGKQRKRRFNSEDEYLKKIEKELPKIQEYQTQKSRIASENLIEQLKNEREGWGPFEPFPEDKMLIPKRTETQVEKLRRQLRECRSRC